MVSWVRNEFKQVCRGVSCFNFPPQERDLVPLRSSKPRASRLVLTLKAARSVTVKAAARFRDCWGRAPSNVWQLCNGEKPHGKEMHCWKWALYLATKQLRPPNLHLLRRQLYLQLFLIFYSRGSFEDKQRN